MPFGSVEIKSIDGHKFLRIGLVDRLIVVPYLFIDLLLNVIELALVLGVELAHDRKDIGDLLRVFALVAVAL